MNPFDTDPFSPSLMMELLFIGGTRHGEFHRTDQALLSVPVPSRPRVGFTGGDTPYHYETFKAETYRYEKIQYRGKSGIQFQVRVMFITPRRAEPSEMLTKWAIEMVLWNERLRETKPERYPV